MSFHAQSREIRRLDEIAVGLKVLLDLVDGLGIYPHRGKYGSAVFITVLADDDVAAAEILEVVGERAQGADDRIRIPTGLVLNPLAFHMTLAEKVFQVDGKFAGLLTHGPSGFWPWTFFASARSEPNLP